jgi:hypothetical protein
MPVVMAAFADRMLLTASYSPGGCLSLMKSPEKVCVPLDWAE